MSTLRQIEKIKQLYQEHDALELVLLSRLIRGAPLGTLWEYHDRLERNILHAEASLPFRVAMKLKEGKL